MNFNSLFGERLKAERSRCGHTQATLAEAIHISREMLGKYERGLAEPGASVLMQLALADIDVHFLLTGQHVNQSSHQLQAEDQALVNALIARLSVKHGG